MTEPTTNESSLTDAVQDLAAVTFDLREELKAEQEGMPSMAVVRSLSMQHENYLEAEATAWREVEVQKSRVNDMRVLCLTEETSAATVRTGKNKEERDLLTELVLLHSAPYQNELDRLHRLTRTAEMLTTARKGMETEISLTKALWYGPMRAVDLAPERE